MSTAAFLTINLTLITVAYILGTEKNVAVFRPIFLKKGVGVPLPPMENPCILLKILFIYSQVLLEYVHIWIYTYIQLNSIHDKNISHKNGYFFVAWYIGYAKNVTIFRKTVGLETYRKILLLK